MYGLPCGSKFLLWGDDMETILIVDDDQALQKTLSRLFESEGYKVEVSSDGRSALEAFRTATPTAIVLDLRLPIMSGKEVCREIRRLSTVPIIVLSAIAEETDKILLLELGANDYVTKPFSPRELLVRVQTAIRRTRKAEISDRVEFGRVSVDFAKMEATVDGQPIELTVHEFRILQFLVKNSERVIPRAEILSEVFGYESDTQTRTVDNHILKLRQKLEKEPANPVHILTLRGAGYKFVA